VDPDYLGSNHRLDLEHLGRPIVRPYLEYQWNLENLEYLVHLVYLLRRTHRIVLEDLCHLIYLVDLVDLVEISSFVAWKRTRLAWRF